MASVRSECGPFGFEGRKFGEAVGLFERLLFSGSFEDFLTVPAYEYLLDLDRSPQA
jgi:malate synthase